MLGKSLTTARVRTPYHQRGSKPEFQRGKQPPQPKGVKTLPTRGGGDTRGTCFRAFQKEVVQIAKIVVLQTLPGAFSRTLFCGFVVWGNRIFAAIFAAVFAAGFRGCFRAAIPQFSRLFSRQFSQQFSRRYSRPFSRVWQRVTSNGSFR